MLYENATRLDPDSESAIEGLLLALLAEANQFMDQGRSEEALKVYDRVLLLDPEDVGAQEGKRKALSSQGSKEEVSQGINETGVGAGLVSQKDIDYYNNLNRSLRADSFLDPLNSAEQWIERGRIFSQNGSYNEAIDSYNRAIGIQSNNSEAWKGEGLALAKIDRHKMARLSFDRALKIDPNDGELWLERAIVSEKLEDYDEAFESYNQSLAYDNKSAIAWLGKGNASLAKGDFNLALMSYENASRLEPGNPLARWGIITALESRGQFLTDQGCREPLPRAYAAPAPSASGLSPSTCIRVQHSRSTSL